MKKNTLEEILFNNCSMTMKNNGKSIYGTGAVKSLSGKKIGTIYHLYGKVNTSNDGKFVQTHLKIDLSKSKVVDYKCSCNKYEQFLLEGHKFYCEHLAASSTSFLIKNNTTNNKVKDEPTVSIDKDKIPLKIQTKISLKKVNSNTYFEADFSIGVNKYINVLDLVSFISAIESGKEIKITTNFIYSNKTYTFEKESLQLLKFIKEKVSKGEITNTKSCIKIFDAELEYFLSIIPINEILFKDQFLQFKTVINRKILPLSFTIKEDNDNYVLTSEKNLPQPLNKKMTVYLFNREFFILNSKAASVFTEIYIKLKRNNWIYLPGNNDSYFTLVSQLSEISNKIYLNESFKKHSEQYIKPILTLVRNENKVYGIVEVKYGNKLINLLSTSKNELSWLRNQLWEEKLLMKLEAHGFVKTSKGFLYTGNEDDLFHLINEGIEEIKTLGNIKLGNGFENVKVYSGIDVEGAIFDEGWAVKLSYGIKGVNYNDFAMAFKAFKEGKEYSKTKDNSYINLKDAKISEVFNVISLMNLENDIWKGMSYIDNNNALIVNSLLETGKLNFLRNKESFLTIEKKLNSINKTAINLPANLIKILRKYQMEGVKWYNTLSHLGLGGILADEMGLGKTLQTISFLTTKKDTTSLIVVPTSLIYNWVSEIQRFSPELKVAIIHGTAGNRGDLLKNYKDYNILLTTYGTLVNDITLYTDLEFDFCIIDEAQNIKNPKANITYEIKKIKASSKFALTGTPIENNLLELWSIFDFILPGILFAKEDFQQKFNKDNPNSLEMLKTLIQPFILRRTKVEVAKDLPDKIEKRILVPLAGPQRDIYSSYVKALKESMEMGNNLQIFSYLTKLRQICLHPRLLCEDYCGSSGKFKVALTLIKNKLKTQGKVLVFSQFTSVLDLFAEELKDNNINYSLITGSTNSKERVELVNNFNKLNEKNVFLISLKAGGTGLNLTSASLVIHLDPWWNPSVENQATDRAHRIGQKEVVEVVKLIAKDTIEEKIILLQEDKKSLIENVIGEGEYNNSIIDKNDLLQILKSSL